jgi:ankyrin repeat protein
LTEGADVNYVYRYMHEGKEISTTQAALNGHADAVRVLMSRGAEVNKQEPSNGFSALHATVEGNCMPVIEFLMSKGASVDVRNILGRTPLHMVAFKGHKEAAIYLLDHRAEINPKDNHGFTSLTLAAQEGHLPLVDLLVLRGADLHLANNARL